MSPAEFGVHMIQQVEKPVTPVFDDADRAGQCGPFAVLEVLPELIDHYRAFISRAGHEVTDKVAKDPGFPAGAVYIQYHFE
jgi:hypothetical protein